MAVLQPGGVKKNGGGRANSRAADAQVEIAVVVEDLVEASHDQVMLFDDLRHVRALLELERLSAAIWERRGGAQQCLALVDAVAEREDVLALARILQGLEATSPFDLDLERSHLPIEGHRAARALVRGAGGHDLHVLDHREDHGDELPAAQLDPAALGIGQQDHGAMPLGQGQSLHGDVADLCQPLALPGADRGPVVQAQALPLQPGRREHGVIPIEDKERLILGEGPARLGVQRAAIGRLRGRHLLWGGQRR
mmetsp:Transcript_93446/g.285961  ORF Transcript_93446/g.285961 Transcript_93446/m.285961 type:complete len:253 (+) Transcript_93446:331-1089(+)